MSTEPIPIEPQLVSYEVPIRSFMLLCSRPERVTTLFRGNMMTLPARNEIHAHKAAVDADGDPIPGSYVVTDIYTLIPELGDEIMTFDASKAVAHVLGLRLDKNKKLSEATSRYAQSGISLCPMNPAKAVWKKIAEAGEKRSFLVDVDNARIYIQDIAVRNGKLQQHGMPPPPSSAEYEHAVFLMNKHAEMTKNLYNASAVASPIEADAMADELELDTYVKARAMELAGKAAASSTIRDVDLAKSMLEDPVILSKLRAEGIRIRRRGFPEKTKTQLDAAAAATLNASLKEDEEQEQEDGQ